MNLSDVILWVIVAGIIAFFLAVLYAVFAWAPGRESRREERKDGTE